MRTQVQKWGNSLALRIPRAFAAELGLGVDAEVDLTLEEGKLVLHPHASRGHRLTTLLDRVTPDNLHAEVDFGPPVGGEPW
jgi:antitoxin MazE